MKTLDKKDYELIHKIARRATNKFGTRFIDTALDLECVNCDLDLQGLLEANDFNFLHDIAGISRHLDRDTGELKNCFRPRYTQ